MRRTGIIEGRREWKGLLKVVLLSSGLLLPVLDLPAAVQLNKEQKDYLKRKQTIVFISQDQYPPFEFVDDNGQSTGICIDLARWMASRAGFEAKFVHKTFLEAQEDVLSGQADVITSLFYSESRDKYFDFTETMVEVPASIFVRYEQHDINNLQDLRRKVIAMQRGDYAQEYLRKSGIPVRINFTSDFRQAFELVVNGNADALIGDEQIVLYQAFKNGWNDRFRIAGDSLYSGQNCMAVKEGENQLLGILNTCLEEAMDERVFDQIYRKWLGVRPPRDSGLLERHRKEILFLAVAVGLLALAVWIWNMQLRRMVSSRTAEVKKREAEYRALTENSTDFIFRHDSHVRIIYVNLAAARFLNTRVRDVQRLTLQEAGIEGDAAGIWENGIREVFATGRPLKLVLNLLHEGIPRWMDCRLVPEFVAKSRVGSVLSTCRDITESKKAEDERRSLEIQMQQAQKLESLGLMAGGIAHDFNNLLAVIKGNAELALMELEKDSSSRTFLQTIDQTTQQAAGLCGQLLAYTGKAKLATAAIDINRLFQETLHMMEVSVEKRAHVEFKLSGNIPLIEADRTQIQQIMLNLVLNAAEAVEKGKGVIRISSGSRDYTRSELNELNAGRTVPKAGGYVYFRVEDNGSGMDEETMGRIFDPFFTTKFTGRGLGLAAVQGIVRSHEGFLTVTSVPGKGSVFTVSFPVAYDKKLEIAKKVKEDGNWRGSGLVLMADDEDTVRTITGKLLAKAGFEVLAASGGREALDLYAKNKDTLKCVLLDLTMPDVDGITVMREIRKSGSTIPVVLCSGYHEIETTALLDVGEKPEAFLEKPYSFGKLLEVMKKVIG